MGIKLSAKFARQESEEARLARIPPDRAETIRRMLGISESEHETAERRNGATGALSCSECNRLFVLPMHLGRHKRAKHGPMNAA
jgi:hypothetical protein